MSIIFYNSAIGPIPVSVIMKERHSSSIGITELPIETGAKITDHSYVEPKKLELEFVDENAALTYMALVRFQESRVPFNIISGLYIYKSMLIKDIHAERDYQTSCILSGSALLQEVILVRTAKTKSEEGDKKAAGNGDTKDKTTKDRTDGPASRGDQPTKPNRSIVKTIISGSGGAPMRESIPGGRGGV